MVNFGDKGNMPTLQHGTSVTCKINLLCTLKTLHIGFSSNILVSILLLCNGKCLTRSFISKLYV